MKLRFDTYTKDCGTAMDAFDGLEGLTDNLTLSLSNWNTKCYNLHGEITSEHVETLNKLCGGKDWNEDYSEL